MEQDSATDDPEFVYNGAFDGAMEIPAAEALYRIVLAEATGKKDFAVIETGTCDGFSTCFIARALEDAGVGRVWTGEICLERSTGQPRPWPQLWIDVGLRHRINACIGDTRSEETWRWAPDEVDIVFIDTEHTFEAVTAEWQTLSPRLKSGGLVLFHDTHIFKCVGDAVSGISDLLSSPVVNHRSSRGLSSIRIP